MRLIIKNNNKPAIVTEPKAIDFDLRKDVNNNVKHKIDFFVKRNHFLVEQTAKDKVS